MESIPKTTRYSLATRNALEEIFEGIEGETDSRGIRVPVDLTAREIVDLAVADFAERAATDPEGVVESLVNSRLGE